MFSCKLESAVVYVKCAPLAYAPRLRFSAQTGTVRDKTGTARDKKGEKPGTDRDKTGTARDKLLTARDETETRT